MVREEEAARVLHPWLGAAFLGACDICARVCAQLNGFNALEGDFAVLYGNLDRLLFRTLREMTGGEMRIWLDDGRTVRVRVDDVDQMADDVLYLLLRTLPRNAAQYARVRQYAMTHESLSALRTLYADFSAFQSDDELRLIARTARTCHAPFRWRGWLPDEA